jgi:hypothetical protein
MANTTNDHRVLSQLFVVIFSLLCGVGVWLVVLLNERDDIRLELLVEQSATFDQRIDISFSPERVPVKLSFPTTELNKMRAENFYIQIDILDLYNLLDGKEERNSDKFLSSEMVKSRNPSLLNMEQLNITVTEFPEPQVQWNAKLRLFPAEIHPVVIGTPKEGYTYNQDDALIEEYGDLMVVVDRKKKEELRANNQEVISISTAPLDVTGRFGVVREQVSLQLPPDVSLRSPSSSLERTIVVEIKEMQIEKQLANIPITYKFVSLKKDLRAIVTPSNVDVIVSGVASAVNKVTPEMITFQLFEMEEKPGETREVVINTRLETNDPNFRGAVSLETVPKFVTVKIVKKETSENSPPGEIPQKEPPAQ